MRSALAALFRTPLCVVWLKIVLAVRNFAELRADEWEKAIFKERNRTLKERLADKFPGSCGLLHNVSKWRAAWQPPRGSVSKKLLSVDPQQAVEEEADDAHK